MMLVIGMYYFNLSLYEAFKHFENKTFNRSRINLGFQLQLMTFETELMESKGISNPKNSLDFLNQTQVNSCRLLENNTTSLLQDVTNTFQQPKTKSKESKKSTVKILPPKKQKTPSTIKSITIPVVTTPSLIVTSSSPLPSALPTIVNEPMNDTNPTTPLRSPIRSRRSNLKTPSSIIKIPFSTLDNASYISPLKSKKAPTLLGTPSLGINGSLGESTTSSLMNTEPLLVDIISDDYSALEFKFDDDEDLEISKALEDRVFMTTPLKKRKTEINEDSNMENTKVNKL